MAKKTKRESQQEMMEILKFTPRTAEITIHGYGGEMAMGTVKPDTVEYFKENFISVPDYAYDSADEEDEDYIPVPEDLQPFVQGSWYECDDIVHVNGAELGSTIEIIDQETNETLFSEIIDEDITSFGCELEQGGEDAVETLVTADNAVFLGQHVEKGTFFNGVFELRQPFNPNRLKITYYTAGGWDIITSVEYDGEDIDGSLGYDTDGKDSGFKFYYENEQGDIAEYSETSDEDMGVPYCGPSPDDWEMSAKIKYSKQQPVHIGWYHCEWSSTWSNNYGKLYWNGQTFVEFVRGKERPISTVEIWQGYSWNTADQSNRPQRPPEVVCENTECDWSGASEERREDDDCVDHCPKCDGIDFDWVGYYPDTKVGKDNRKKYSVGIVKKPIEIYPYPGEETCLS